MIIIIIIIKDAFIKVIVDIFYNLSLLLMFGGSNFVFKKFMWLKRLRSFLLKKFPSKEVSKT